MKKEKENIDLGEWNVPTKWEDISLKKYEEIERYYADKDNDFNVAEVLHILCDKPLDEVNSLPLEFTEKILSHLAFMQEAPDVSKPTNEIEIDGEKYRIATEKTLKFGEYVSTDSVMKADKHDYASLLAILCRKEGEVYDSKFEAELFDERKAMFEKQPITKILPMVAFFLALYGLTIGLSQAYSEVQEEADRLVKNIKSSQKLGAFKKRYMIWRVKRILKSLK